jgi:hypothetical protein
MRAAAALLSTALIATACHAGGSAERTGPAVAREMPVAGAFDRIALSGSPDVVVTVGGPASVRAEGDQETLDRLEITNQNGELQIGLRSTSGNWFSWGHHGGLTVHVTLPALAGASVTGSGDMRIDRVQGPRFAGSITGSGDMEVGNVAVGEASFAVTGSGGITAAGTAQQATGSVTGSGDLHLDRLEAANATLAVAGSGDIGIRATQTAAIELRGSGDVTVAGPARCTISKSGSGDAHCGG